jgi:hypothetical protein
MYLSSQANLPALAFVTHYGMQCDQARPGCDRCRKANRTCAGYRDQNSLWLRDETQSVVQKALAASSGLIYPAQGTVRSASRENTAKFPPNLSAGPQSPLIQSTEIRTQERGKIRPRELGYCRHESSSLTKGLDYSLTRLFESALEERTARRLVYYYQTDILPALLPYLSEATNGQSGEIWLGQALNHPAQFSSRIYAAAIHEQARRLSEQPQAPLQTRRAKVEIMIAEYEATQRIREAIEDASQALTDEVLMAVYATAFSKYDASAMPSVQRSHRHPLRNLQWLEIYGGLSCHKAHLTGLFQILTLKGGLEAIKMEGRAEQLSVGGVVLASRTLSKPPFPFLSFSNRNNNMRDKQPEWPPHIASLLSTHEDGRSFYRFLEVGLTHDLVNVLQDMYSYNVATEMYSQGVLRNLSICVMVDRRNSIQHRLMSLPSAKELNNDHFQPQKIYELCRISAIIYSLLAIFPLPTFNAPFPQLALMLRQTLVEIDLPQIWKTIPDLLLWILMLGGIASIGNERMWFVVTLRCLGVTTSIRNWGALKHVMKSIMWLDCVCDSDGEVLWDEISNLVSGDRNNNIFTHREQY